METDDAPTRKKAAATAPAGQTRRLNDLNLRELDKCLPMEEQAEWNAIYASYRSRSILTGTVIGVDRNIFEFRDRLTGKTETKVVYSAVIINHRVKVLIPETEMWAEDAQWAGHILRSMVGAKLEFIILDIDRENGCAVASRRMAIPARRKYFDTAPQGHKEGDRLECQVLASGLNRCLISCNSYDRSLPMVDMTYSSVYDLRLQFRAGQELFCVLTEYGEGKFKISVKDATSNPFDGSDFRHPLGARREVVITGNTAAASLLPLPMGCPSSATMPHSSRTTISSWATR